MNGKLNNLKDKRQTLIYMKGNNVEFEYNHLLFMDYIKISAKDENKTNEITKVISNEFKLTRLKTNIIKF